jgi:hypothetical protein
MADKFIPNGDLDFKMMAEKFARAIAAEPSRFHVSQADSEVLTQAVEAYSRAYQITHNKSSRTTNATREKDQARAAAERIIRKWAAVIRANDAVDSIAKRSLGLRERPEKMKSQPCPAEPPRLRFLRALHEGNGSVPVHELEFRAMDWSSRKPAGAVRLELFIDLIPPDEPIPTHPGANHGSRPWYLRSYTRSPIRLTPPMAKVPMRIVYWARWADSTGNVGPFSATAAAWIEGGNYLPSLPLTMGAFGAPQPLKILDQARAANWPDRDPIYRTALLEAQDESYTKHVVPALPQMTEKEIPQLAGPEMRDEQERAEEAA